ncbi:hypothetical protein QVD17_30318 [Tagetes erecta]|uniref:Uncharacterized protein n=1 Tax=Tagetes erecta TaxID=13708 RepID=A0AAD8NN60_TARER|nr:hypothetical protein QVD17_30318 [Tagetes erecta]
MQVKSRQNPNLSLALTHFISNISQSKINPNLSLKFIHNLSQWLQLISIYLISLRHQHRLTLLPLFILSPCIGAIQVPEINLSPSKSCYFEYSNRSSGYVISAAAATTYVLLRKISQFEEMLFPVQ